MLSRWQRHIVSESGDVIPDAEVEVTVAGESTLADLYEDADGNTGKTNPFNADGGGYAFFYVAGGTYDIYVNGVKIWENVQLGTAQRRDIGTGTNDLPDVQAFGGPTPAEIGKGAIVESDTNDNGSYVRWENGEQVCWMLGSASYLDPNELEENISYPASFIDDGLMQGSLTMDNARNASFSTEDLRTLISNDQFGPSSVDVRLFLTDDVAESGDYINIAVLVWGFWK